MAETERLQKILARAGYGSRRACEALIEDGRVAVDGKIAQLGDQANPTKQRITVDGTPVRSTQPDFVYVMLHKPRGVLSTTTDPQGRSTVLDLVTIKARIYPVGRLDYNSEGLILLTNDGTLTQELTHPGYRHPRIYRVLVKGEPPEEVLERWKRGITIEGRYTRFDDVVAEHTERGQTWLRVTVHEGRKHLVRRVVAALGFPALRLIRIEMGPLHLGNLASGKWRHLSESEIKALKEKPAPKKSRSPRRSRRTSSQSSPNPRRNKPSEDKRS